MDKRPGGYEIISDRIFIDWKIGKEIAMLIPLLPRF